MDALYFAFLRGKLGEAEATGSLSPRTHALTCPTYDLSLPRETESVEEHTCALVRAVTAAWGTSSPVGIDVSRYGPDLVSASGELAVHHAFECARQCRLRAMPIARPMYLAEPLYLEAIRRIAEKDGHGAIVRMPVEDVRDGLILPRTVDQLLMALNLRDADVVLVLDMGPLSVLPANDRSERALVTTLNTAISTLAGRPFRRLVVAASSVPEKTIKHTNGAAHMLARTEMAVWRQLAAVRDPVIAFGDYGARFANQTDPDGVVVPPSRVHLATEGAYFLYKAEQRHHRELCRSVARTREFLAQRECWGRNAVLNCGIGIGSVGSAQDWVARDTNMHIESTAESVATYLASIQKFAEPTVGTKQAPWLQAQIVGLE